MIVAACLLLAAGTLVYVFYPQHGLLRGREKSRLEFLRERREVLYENLRDLSFENKAGKLSPQDYESLRADLEDEAAALLAEIDELEHAEPSVAEV